MAAHLQVDEIDEPFAILTCCSRGLLERSRPSRDAALSLCSIARLVSMTSLTLEQRMEDAMATLEELRSSEDHARWRQERFSATMDEGLKRFDAAIVAAEARVMELERQMAAATAGAAAVRGKATRDEEVRRLLEGFPHVTANFVDKAGKPHAGLKRHAERLTDIGLSVMKARKVLPAVTDEDVASLGPQHDGLRQAIVVTNLALEEGERALSRQSRDLVWAAEHGWAFVDAMTAPDPADMRIIRAWLFLTGSKEILEQTKQYALQKLAIYSSSSNRNLLSFGIHRVVLYSMFYI